ncbi:MAG: FMN-binding protein [Pseudomonadota bacterium]|nr:FMN-binding protein [Pseudomonadota bacterium]
MKGHHSSVCGLLLSFLIVCPGAAWSQQQWRNLQSDWLFEVMPQAISFSQKSGSPPVIRAFSDPEQEQLIGLVFTTPDIPPEEVGFSGPLHLLVGMDLEGVLTGTKVLYYTESYRSFRGDFVEDAGFTQQLKNKSIADAFRLGTDIDTISRATITSWALTRGVRNAARRVAEAYLINSEFSQTARSEISALETFAQLDWSGLIDAGLVRQFSTQLADRASLDIAVAYMGHGRLGDMLIGSRAYSNLERTLGEQAVEGNLLLLGLRGSTARLQQKRLALIQNEKLFRPDQGSILFAGTGEDGKIAGQASLAVAMVMPDSVDPREAFSLVYGTGISLDPFASFDEVRYQLPADLSDFLYGSEYEGATAVLTTADSEPERPWILLWSTLAGTLLLVAIVHLRRRFKLGQ